MARALLMILFVSVPFVGACRSGIASQAEAVILLHGLGRTDRSMRPLEKRLTNSGFQVYNFRYRSTDKTPEAVVDDLSAQVEACCTEVPSLHFVGHSLGGILIRAYLAKEPPSNIGRVVMLAPPNHGSELVDALSGWALFRWALGPTAQQLGTGMDSLPNRLPPPAVEVGVVAGTSSVNPIGSFVIPDEDDGMVSVASTKLEGMSDFLVVPSSHAFIMRGEEVSVQVVHFLRTGRFRHEASD
ncbi:MAG: esterase/lipase family protein [Candidatus Binatia bacterium]